MERQKKEQLTARDPERAWETIREMILDDEGMTMEELDAELREFGINPDDSIRRLFDLALRIARKPDAGGRVSPHVSEILNQLAAKCCRAEMKSSVTQDDNFCSPGRSSSEKEMPTPIIPKAKAAVLSYHRNFKEESLNDRAIRLKNEKRLREMAESAKQRKDDSKK